jgi:hypothetical protein
MDRPVISSQSQARTTAPQIGTYAPDFQREVLTVSHSEQPSSSSFTPENQKQKPTTLYIIIVLLAVMICFCVAAAIFLWFAPESFWRTVFDVFGIPWPSQPMFFYVWQNGNPIKDVLIVR